MFHWGGPRLHNLGGRWISMQTRAQVPPAHWVAQCQEPRVWESHVTVLRPWFSSGQSFERLVPKSHWCPWVQPPVRPLPGVQQSLSQRGSAPGEDVLLVRKEAGALRPPRERLQPGSAQRRRNAGPEARPFNSPASGHICTGRELPPQNSGARAPSRDRPRAPATRGRGEPCSHHLFWSNRVLHRSLPALRTQSSSCLQLQL